MGNCYGKKSKKAKESLVPSLKKDFLTFVESSDTMQDHYTIIKKIGQGATSHVKLVECKYTNVQRAIKTLSISSERNLKKAQEEVRILKIIDHPALMRSVESFKDSTSIHIVSEYYSGQTLFDRLESSQKISEHEALTLMYYLLSGINYLHKHKIMHRDIKPENLMFESSDPDSMLRIIDFGTAKYRHKIAHKKKTGTILYMSPQVIDGKYTEKCDIWSLGIIFCIMLTGVHPFYCESEQDMMEKVRKLPVQFNVTKWDGISPQTKQIISKMLEKREENRASAEELLKNSCFNMKFVIQKREVQDISEKMKIFTVKNDIQMMLINIGIVRVLESKHLSKYFLYLDHDSDGCVDLSDLLTEKKNPKKHLITFSDFLIKITNWDELLNTQVLEGIFRQLDDDKDNLVSVQDFFKYYNQQETIHSMQSYAPINNSCPKVDFKEFSSSFKN